eukprot:Opistho-2@30886
MQLIMAMNLSASRRQSPLPLCGARMLMVVLAATIVAIPRAKGNLACVRGDFFEGCGNDEYVELLETGRRMFDVDATMQTVAMLYSGDVNAMVEGPTWNAWWTQNSYGATYTALPFMQEPLRTFVQNSQNFWFDHIGDGSTVDPQGNIGPDGCLCDDGGPTYCRYKQGDGIVWQHDFALEESLSAVVMQAELLLIDRDPAAIAHYLPLMRRTANLVESRRDANNDLYMCGDSCDLLAPSFGGYVHANGSRANAFFSGLSVSYAAALERLAELETLAGDPLWATEYRVRRERTVSALHERYVADSGDYLVKSIDPDGVVHGVLGASKHGYFQAVVNHDAVCFGAVNETLARAITQKMASMSELRPFNFTITNYPSLDDMEVDATSSWLWSFGTWVNGGAWGTCEARMIMAFARFGFHQIALNAMRTLMSFSRAWRMDSPLVNFGKSVYQPSQPINLVYDNFGIPGALIRSLFAPKYDAVGVTLTPSIPRDIVSLRQKFPVRLADKRLFLSSSGVCCDIASVSVNGKPWGNFTAAAVVLPYDQLPAGNIDVVIVFAKDPQNEPHPFRDMGRRNVDVADAHKRNAPSTLYSDVRSATLEASYPAVALFVTRMRDSGLGESYECAHADLFVRFVDVMRERRSLAHDGKLNILPDPASQAAADASYPDTAMKLLYGLNKVISGYRTSQDQTKSKIYSIWSAPTA